MIREERTRIGWKKISTCMVMLIMSLFLMMMNTRTVNAETIDCEVHYDAARNAVQTGNTELGKDYQLDADLCEIVKQIVVNGASELPYYRFSDPDWIGEMMDKTGGLKSCTGGYSGFILSADTMAVQAEIVKSMEEGARFYSDYNLMGVSIISTSAEQEDGKRWYWYTTVYGKGTCKPSTNTGTRKEVLTTSNTVTFTDNSSNNNSSSAGSVTNKPTKVTSVTIDKTSKTLLTGKNLTLTAIVLPSDASNKKLVWSVNNKKYAAVDQNGVIKAKAAGAGKTIIVTAKAQDGSGKKATYKIKIKGAVSKITLKAQKSVKAGKKVTIKSTVKVGKGGNKALKWTTSNNSWATVNAKGVVTTKKAGKGQKVKITATAKDGSGKKASVTIKLK